MINKKSVVLFLSSLFALLIIFGVLSFLRQNNTTTYEDSNEPIFLAASFSGKTEKNLAEWETEILNRKSSVSQARVSYTESIAKSALTEYFKAKNANAAINEEEIAKKIIQTTSTESLKKEIEFVEYQLFDLKIIPETNQETLREYGNELGKASTKNAYDRTYGDEFEIFNQAMVQNDPIEYEKLKPIIANYEKLIADIIKIETPTSIAGKHLDIINSLSAVNGSIREFNVFLTDPIRGLFVLGKYGKYASDLRNTLKALDKIMKENAVNFTTTDPGYSIERAANVSIENQQ